MKTTSHRSRPSPVTYVAWYSLLALLLLIIVSSAIHRASALTGDQTQLVQLANQIVVNTNTTNTAYVDGMAIYGNYALVSWTNTKNAGGEVVAQKVGTTWKALFGGGGAYTATDLQTKGLDATTAAYLTSHLAPLQPSGDTASMPISGSSTSNVTTVYCSAPPPNLGYKYTASTSVVYTINAQPTTSDTAIDVNISATGQTRVDISASGTSGAGTGAIMQANTTGGVSYWSPSAPATQYYVTISGTAAAKAPLCSYNTVGTTTTNTDTTWSGTIFYH